MNERELYPHVVTWLSSFLRDRYKRSKVDVYDTSAKMLSTFLYEKGLSDLFPRSDAFEIQVDITGVIRSSKQARLAFVECKTHTVSLKDVSQLLGYSLVARPLFSFLVSTGSVSTSVWKLVEDLNYLDILKYDDKRYIRICQWDTLRKEVKINSVIPRGMQFPESPD